MPVSLELLNGPESTSLVVTSQEIDPVAEWEAEKETLRQRSRRGEIAFASRNTFTVFALELEGTFGWRYFGKRRLKAQYQSGHWVKVPKVTECEDLKLRH